MAKRFPMLLGLLAMFALGLYAGGVFQPRTAQAAAATVHTTPVQRARVATSIVYVSNSEACSYTRAAQGHLNNAYNELAASRSDVDYLNYIHWHNEFWIPTTGYDNAMYTDIPGEQNSLQQVINALNAYNQAYGGGGC